MASLPLFDEIIFIALLLFAIMIFFFYRRCKRREKSFKISNTLEIYKLSQKILNISNADFVAMFRYKNRDNRFITTHFMFSIDKNNNIQHEVVCTDLPATFNSFSSQLLLSDDKTLHEIYKGTIPDTESQREIFNKTFKVYFQNVFDDKNNPIGYLTMSYENEYIMPEQDKKEIIKLIHKIKKLIE